MARSTSSQKGGNFLLFIFIMLFSIQLYGQNNLVKDRYGFVSEKYVSDLIKSDEKITSLSEWKSLYHLLQRNNIEFLPTRKLLRKSRGEIAQSIPIGIIDFNSFFFENKNLGNEIFLCAPLKDYSYSQSVSFHFDDKYFFTDNKNKITRFDILDKNGTIINNVKFGEHFTVSFNTKGRKTLRFSVVTESGTKIKTGFKFILRDEDVPPPDETWQLQADIAYNDTAATGEAYILLSDQNSSLTNPIIVIEGYDPDSTNNWPELYENMNQENMIEDLLAMGYDAVALNFSDGATFIQRNAYLVEKLIDTVNTVTGRSVEHTVIGASMGGLVSRYALLDMENNGRDHNTRLFISFDSPQKGADAPLGLQYFGDFFAPYVEDGDSLLAASDTPASKQMIVYHYTDPPSSTGDPHPWFPALQNELATMGEYPQNLRKVAIINGSGKAQDQGYDAGDQIIQFDIDGSFLFHYRGNVWAVPDGNSTMIFDGIYMIAGGANDSEQITVGGTKPYDNAPGGYIPTMREMEEGDTVFNAIQALHDNHCFIPTVSALALDTEDLFYNVDADPNILDLTPFDAIYYPDTNEQHITITPATKQWFIDEITGTVPVELISFAAKIRDENILLYWRTATETNNKGFQVQRKKAKGESIWESIGFVEGAGNSVTTREYSYTDVTANVTQKYFYRLKQIDFDGTYHYSPVVEFSGTLPTKFALHQNYPNPFSKSSSGKSETKIKFDLPKNEFVSLKVYDILGRQVAVLVNAKREAGSYELIFKANDLPSGIYIYSIRAGEFIQSKKMILLK